MKRFIYNIVPFIIALVLLQSCEKVTTEGFTEVTSFPVVTVNGDPIIFIKAGEPYTDPGVTATLDGQDVTEKIVVKSTVNTSAAGKYTVSYSVTNEDGFSAQESRVVYVFDATATALESKLYTVATGTNRNGSPMYDGYSIAVYQTAPGVFAISDFLGGYYDVRAGYGAAYAAVGSFKLNTDNTLTLISSSVAGWSDSLEALNNGLYNPATSTLSFTSFYANFNFNVILR